MKSPHLINSHVFLILFAMVFCAGSRASSVYTGTIAQDIAGYWPFDETTGRVAHEASGVGYDGTLVNFGPQGNWVPGPIGNSLWFGGLAGRQYVTVPNFTKPTTSLTLSAWVWADALPNWAKIAANWGGYYGALNYGVFSSTSYLSLYMAEKTPGGAINIISGNESLPPGGATPFTLGVWHYVAVVADGDSRTVRFYRDGRAEGSFSFSGVFAPAPVPNLDIGGASYITDPSQGFWSGKIDDIAIWTRALSSEELSKIYQAGLEGKPLLSLVPEPSSASLFVTGFILTTAVRSLRRRTTSIFRR